MTAFRRTYPVLASLLSLVVLACASRGESGSSSALARIAELEKENAELRETVETLNARIAAIMTSCGDVFGTVCPVYPKVDAFVLSVDHERKLVVLDKGEKEAVKIGFVFTVYRGSTYKGQVRVTQVEPGMSTGQIVNEKNDIATGDSATTVL